MGLASVSGYGRGQTNRGPVAGIGGGKCTSEEAILQTWAGSGFIVDYSISQVGPGEYAKELWRYAIARGHKAVAKVQSNNTWECSAIPYIPAVDLVEKHLDQLSSCGVTGLMASWHRADTRVETWGF